MALPFERPIEELQANRYQMVHLFDSIVRTLPDGLVLTSMKQEGESLTLQGRAQSNARVATYMRNLESSGWMTKPEVSVIEVGAATPAAAAAGAATPSTVLPYVFTLKVTLANPNAPKDPNAPPTPDPVVTPMPAPAVQPQATPAGTPPASTQPAPAATVPPPATTPAPAATAPTATPAAPAPANQGK